MSVAIVGASARAAAQSALRAGLRPLAADLFADADLAQAAVVTRLSPYPRQLLEWLPATACQAWMYVGGLENYPRLVARLAAQRPLWGNDANVLRSIRSPLQLAVALHAAGLGYPETHGSRSPTAPRITRSNADQWLLKPLRGSGGRGICRAGAAPSPPVATILQRRVAGDPAAALFVGNRRSAICLGVTRQLVGQSWTGAAEFQYCGSITPWPVEPVLWRQIKAIGDVLAATFGLVGFFGVDLLLDSERAWVVEVNPRYTASVEVIERAAGIPLLQSHVAACTQGELPTGTPLPTRSAGKAILFAASSLTLDEQTVARLLLGTAADLPRRLADIPSAGTCIAAGQPILSLLVDGEGPQQVWEALKEEAAAIGQQLATRQVVAPRPQSTPPEELLHDL